MEKKALALVSFGTSCPQARQSIARIEDALVQARPEHQFFRAFTSGMIIRKIEREEGIRIPTPGELMEQLAQEGYREVVCQSLHVIPGFEYEKLCTQLAPFAGHFARLEIGKPLLYEQADFLACARALLQCLPGPAADEALVWMGHGTGHIANGAYALLENTFRFLGGERIYVGTVEGFPDLDYVMERLQAHGVRRVLLAPLMIVAGDHAQNDLAGDQADSWKSRLARAGYAVRVQMKGLGDYPEIAARFAAHLPR